MFDKVWFFKSGSNFLWLLLAFLWLSLTCLNRENTSIRTSTVCLGGRILEQSLRTSNEKLILTAMMWQWWDFLLWARYRHSKYFVLLYILPYLIPPSLDSLTFASLLIFYCPEAKNSYISIFSPPIKNQSSFCPYWLLWSESLCPTKFITLQF